MLIGVCVVAGFILFINTFALVCVAFSFSNWLDAKTKQVGLENAPKCGNLCCMYRKKEDTK